MEGDIIYKIATWIMPILLAITLHEYAHGWVANKLGDTTAKMLGRLTINPIKHIDPVGTILIPAALLLLTNGAFIFGYAKPIPVNTNNLKNIRKDMAIIAVAGPLSNLAMAFGWVLLCYWRLMVFLATLISAKDFTIWDVMGY